MKRGSITILLIVAVISITMGEKGKVQISETDFMEAIKDKLPELKGSEIDVLVSEAELEGTEGVSDIEFKAGLSYGNTKGYTGYERMSSANIYTEATRKFVNTGTSLSAGVEYALTKTDYGTADTDTYAPRIYVNVSQPLLQNAMGKLDAFAGANAELALETAKIRKIEQDKALLNGYRKLYYLWCSLEQQLDIVETSIRNAEAVLDEVEKRYRNGLADRDEVDQSLSSVISYKERYENVRLSIDQLKASLSPLIDTAGKKPDKSLFQAMYTRVMSYEYGEPAFNGTGTYLMLQNALKQAGLSIDYHKDKMRPQLILSAGVAVKTSEDEFGESFGVNDADFNTSLTFSMPLGNRRARADAVRAELQFESLVYELDSALNSYLSNIRKLKVSIENSEEMYRLRDENIRALKSQYEIQMDKYRQARVEISNVIEADNRIALEKLNIINLQYGLIEDYLEFNYLTGRE